MLALPDHRHRVPRTSALLLCLLAAAVPSRAMAQGTGPLQTPASPPLESAATRTQLADLIAGALANNPELAAARARVAAADLRPVQAAALPDPVLGFTYRNVGFPSLTLGDEMMSMAGVSFTQALPAVGKRPLRAAVAAAGADVARARIEPLRRRLVREVAAAFFELAFVTESIAIVEETKTLMESLEATAESRYAVGDGIQQDVLRAQVEISGLLNRLIQLQQQRATTETRIQQLIAGTGDSRLAPPAATAMPAQPLDLDTLLREAEAFSALLAMHHEQIEQQRAAVELARLDKRPDLVLTGSWMNRGALPSLWQVNVGITLPVRQAQRQQPAIEEGLQELEARRQSRSSAGIDVAASIRAAYLQADRSARLVALFRDATIPQSLLSLESAMASYTVGNVDFLTVLNNVITLLTYRLELERETSAYMVALASLEEHVGHSLGATPESIWAPARGSTPSAAPGGAAPGSFENNRGGLER